MAEGASNLNDNQIQMSEDDQSSGLHEFRVRNKTNF
jgi:hypothetical protein